MRRLSLIPLIAESAEPTEQTPLYQSPQHDYTNESPLHSRKCSVASMSRVSKTHQVTSEELWMRREKDMPWIWYNDLYFIGPLVLVLSLLVGIFFYIIYNGWTVGSATFCATATLIGAIYGVPNQPDNVGAAFTIGYYIYGISLFTAIIGAIIGSMITRAPLISAQARRRIAQLEQPEDTDGDGEIGFYDYCFFLRERFLHWINWEFHSTNYLVTAAAITWVILGILYGMYIEEWTFEHSVYFAMNAVSMAALADPPCEDGESDNCDIGFYRGLTWSIYLLVGVPLFTLMLAQLASLVINKAVRENEYKIINQPLTQEEYNYAANLYGNDEVLSLGEFTVLELLRLQRVSMEDLEHIKNLFCAIDEASTGVVDKPMLEKRNLYYGTTDENGRDIGPRGGSSSAGRGRDRASSTTSNRSNRSIRTRDRDRDRDRESSRSRSGTLTRHVTSTHAPSIMKFLEGEESVLKEGEDGAEEEEEDREGYRTGDFEPDDVNNNNDDGDNNGEKERRGEGQNDYPELSLSGKWRAHYLEGASLASTGSRGSNRDSHRSSVAPEVPTGIKRMTMHEYNKMVVPLAFTTLIENYEESGAEGNDHDDISVGLSSHGKLSEGEEGDVDNNWHSDHHLRSSRDWSGNNLAGTGGGFNGGGPSTSFKNLLSESEREEDEQMLIGKFAQQNSMRRERRPPSKKKSRKIRGRSSRDRNLGDIEEGYES